MKTFRANREAIKAKMQRWRDAKERRRMERMAGEAIRVEWRGRLEYTITFHDRQTGVIHSLDLYRGTRRDQYRATVDGKPWRTSINATQLGKLVREKFKPHVSCE